MRKIGFVLGFSSLAVINAEAANYIPGKTSLMVAAEYNDVQTISRLIKSGYDVNKIDSQGNSAYCYAFFYKNYEAMRTLEYYGSSTRNKCKIDNVSFNSKKLNYGEVSGNVNPTMQVESGSNVLLYTGLGVAAAGGIAMAVGGGGGGGSSSSGGGSISFSTNPADYQTSEFYGDTSPFTINDSDRSTFLDIINAQYAYARGYYGQGQKIAILDSGINLTHQEFSNKLNGDLTNTNQQAIVNGSGDYNNPNHGPTDNAHGTNVAGVAAANKDNSVMHGVAYKATVIPYRMGVEGVPTSVDSSRTDEAINDGIAKGARIFNLSYGVNADAVNNASVVTKDDLEGGYTGGYIAGEGSDSPFMTNLLNNIITSNSIIVRAAGNDGYSQSGEGSSLPLKYPSMNGYFINVVGLNKEGTSIATNANSGWASNHCGVTKNYCIAAPGSAVMTPTTGGDDKYKLQYGTSFASPIVAGSVAVVKSAFPYMSAPQITNVIFKTATDLGAPGVDDVYGNGLINLQAATSPGAKNLAVGSGNKLVRVEGSSVSGSSAIASVEIPNFIMTDSLDRTFNVESKNFITVSDNDIEISEKDKTFAKNKKLITRNINDKLKTAFIMSDDIISEKNLSKFDFINFNTNYKNLDLNLGFIKSPGQDIEDINFATNLLKDEVINHPYLNLAEKGFNAKSSYNIIDNINLETSVFFGDIVNEDDSDLGKSTSFITKLNYKQKDTKLSLETGFVNENKTVLGSKFEGAFALANNTYTYFSGVSGKTSLTKNITVFGNAYIGLTKLNSTSNSLVDRTNDLVSHSASLGLNYKINDKNNTGFILSQPLKVSSGSMGYSLATSRNLDGSYNFTSVNQSLAPDATEFDVQAFYKHKLQKKASLSFGAIHRFNADNKFGEKDTAILTKLRCKF